MRIYLDTSIPSTYFDERTPDRQQTTQAFWSKASLDSELLISELVLAEIEQTPQSEKRLKMLGLVDSLTTLSLTEEVIRLGRVLHQANLVPANKLDDALHLALAAVEGVDVVVSWNFRHMVNLKVKRDLPVLLAQERYFRQYEIISPYEYAEG